MANSLQRRLRVLVAAAAVGLAVWKYAPSISGFTELDRAVFETSIGSFANPPYFVSGNGSHEQPWTLRTLTSGASKNRQEAPSVISIGNDPDGVFQSSPPSAVDYAVILRNLKRLGVRRVAIPAVMAWDEPDPIALTAVDARLADFESAVTAAPLSRGAVGEDLPLPFLLASIPAEKVKGDVGSLPLVNRLAFPRTFLGSGKTLAGFSILESEPGPPALLARWKDRIVFSFPVIAALADAGQQADRIEVRLGSYLKLGPGGPVVPVDAGGRLASPEFRSSGKEIPAQSVIDATAMETTETVLIRDDRTTADPGTKQFSGSVADIFTSIRHESGLAPPKAFNRLSAVSERILLAVLVFLLTACASPSIFRLRVNFGALAVLILIAQLTALAWGPLWLPLYPSLCAIAAGYLVARPLKGTRSARQSREVPGNSSDAGLPVVGVTSPDATTAKGVPARKAAKKIAATAVEPVSAKAVKKVAKKAAPAKKTAKKAAKKSPKPPKSK